MPSTPPQHEALSDLDDIGAGLSDIDITIPTLPSPSTAAPKKDDLGLDDDVKVRKRRVTVKLDADRLLGPNGLGKLQKEAPKKLKFKGKGHEYRDAQKLLQYYQLWADDLFKKAKFRDTLQIVEKLGHSRPVRMQRDSFMMEAKKKAWEVAHPGEANAENGEGDEGTRNDEEGRRPDPMDENDDDLYSLPIRRPPPGNANGGPGSANANGEAGSGNGLFLDNGLQDDEDEFGMDDWDADIDAEELMRQAAEQSTQKPAAAPINGTGKSGSEKAPAPEDFPEEFMDGFPPEDEDEFADQMAVLREMEGM